MRIFDKSQVDFSQCISVQLNGIEFCSSCKFTRTSACMGKEIVATGVNSKGFKIGSRGLACEARPTLDTPPVKS